MDKPKKNGHFIFRTSKMVNGVKIYAADYGKKCFAIWISED